MTLAGLGEVCDEQRAHTSSDTTVRTRRHWSENRMFVCLPSTTLKCFSGEVAKQERHIAVTMVSLGRHDKTVIYINVSSATSFFLFLPVLAFSISLCFLFYLWFSRTSILSCFEITHKHTRTPSHLLTLTNTNNGMVAVCAQVKCSKI